MLAYARHLPAYGVTQVKPGELFDMVASHAAGSRSPDVLHCHGLNWTAEHTPAEYEYRVNAELVEAIRKARVVTVPSQWVADVFRRDMHYSPEVIGHGIDWAEWEGGPDEGYILWNKNRADAICNPAPMDELARNRQNRKFVSTFGTPAPNVTITGVVPFDAMKRLIQRAHIYLATTQETYGIGTLEAMACGVPILGYDWGGTSDIVTHGYTGYLARPGDIADLIEGLHYCEINHAELSANAREAVKAHGWDKVCQDVAKVYEMAMAADPPTTTVVIPAYNKAATVGQAIASVAAQTLKPTKLVVVDDGSTDDTGRAATGALSQVSGIATMYIRQDNGGVARARNRGLAEVNTKYVAFLDADDMLHPDFLAVCVKGLEDDRALGLAYTGLRVDGRNDPNPWPGEYNYNFQIARRNQVPTCCVIRTEAIRRAGGYRAWACPTGAGSEDAELWTRLGALGWAGKRVSPGPLFIYRAGQGHTAKPGYREPDWLAWKPWVNDGGHPFASVASPKLFSHPAREYTDPKVSVVIHGGPGDEQATMTTLDSIEGQAFRKWEVTTDNLDVSFGLARAYPFIRYEAEPQAERVLHIQAGDYLLPGILSYLATMGGPGHYHMAWPYVFMGEG
jgi:hypothetical protein